MELKDWLNSINHTKANLLEEDPDSVRKYPPYIINRCMSGHIDAILFANEMNKHPNLDKDMQYSFLSKYIEKTKTFFSLVEERTSRRLGSGQKTLWL